MPVARLLKRQSLRGCSHDRLERRSACASSRPRGSYWVYASVVAYTTCARQEMRPFRGIHICTILPVGIDTPIYQKGANYVGRKARLLVPLYDVERVAKATVQLADRPRAETIVGTYGYLMSLVLRLSASLVERIIGRLAPNIQLEATEGRRITVVSLKVRGRTASMAAGGGIGGGRLGVANLAALLDRR